MIDAATLLELSRLNLSAEQLAGVLRILARSEQAAEELRNVIETRKNKERTRQQRYASRKNDVSDDVDLTSLARTVVNTTNLQEVSINTPLSPLPSSRASLNEPEGFQKFWEVYPPRDGPRDRKAAVKAFRAALKRSTLEEILAGAATYRSALEAKGKLNTEFVKQARTWLNADGWKEIHSAPMATILGIRSPKPSETREEYIRRLAAMSRA
jgi:hypothetical protein